MTLDVLGDAPRASCSAWKISPLLTSPAVHTTPQISPAGLITTSAGRVPDGTIASCEWDFAEVSDVTDVTGRTVIHPYRNLGHLDQPMLKVIDNQGAQGFQELPPVKGHDAFDVMTACSFDVSGASFTLSQDPCARRLVLLAKTPGYWAGGRRALTLKCNDQSVHSADMQL